MQLQCFLVLITFSLKGPPPDPGYNFLSDRSREGPFPDSKQNVHRSQNQQPFVNRRHPRNYGGPNIRDVKSKILHEKHRDVSVLAMNSVEFSMKFPYWVRVSWKIR